MSKGKITDLYMPKKEGKNPLKRSMSGYETENFILNSDGSLDHSSKLYDLIKKKNKHVKPECAKSMIELICMPNKKLVSSSLSLLNNLSFLSEEAKKHENLVYPFATYPGINRPVFRRSAWYNAQEKILGKRWKNAGMCCGYHQHYAMPRGLFDNKKKFLNYNLNSKVKRTFVDSYNFLIGSDPVFSTLLQSSPFVDCKYLSKDSRMLLYRGGSKLSYKGGLYANRQFFGGLPPYKQTLKDLLSTIRRRHRKFKRLVSYSGYSPERFNKKDDVLKFAWNPVKVNSKGTLEYRGSDMNYISNIFGVATMMKFALRKIQQDFLIVVPYDIDLKDSFKVEKNIIFIPPHTVVRKNLQRKAAHDGIKDKSVRTYVNAFYKFIKSEVYDEYQPLLKPIKTMIDQEETMSDKILNYAQRKGNTHEFDQDFAKEMAIHFSKKFEKDIETTREKLENLYFK